MQLFWQDCTRSMCSFVPISHCIATVNMRILDLLELYQMLDITFTFLNSLFSTAFNNLQIVYKVSRDNIRLHVREWQSDRVSLVCGQKLVQFIHIVRRSISDSRLVSSCSQFT